MEHLVFLAKYLVASIDARPPYNQAHPWSFCYICLEKILPAQLAIANHCAAKKPLTGW
jgi:hypothetical protein